MSLRMHMNAGLLVGLLSGYCFAGDVDQVVTAIRESTQDTTKLTACLLLSQSASTSKADARTKKKAVELVTQRLKNQDVAMLRARGDVARKGLYGYERNEELAYRLYSKATRSVEAGWNGALMLYRRSPNGVSASDARLILDLLQKSGAATQNSRGLVGSYSHYVAGLLNEAGTAGKPDLKKAFYSLPNLGPQCLRAWRLPLHASTGPVHTKATDYRKGCSDAGDPDDGEPLEVAITRDHVPGRRHLRGAMASGRGRLHGPVPLADGCKDGCCS